MMTYLSLFTGPKLTKDDFPVMENKIITESKKKLNARKFKGKKVKHESKQVVKEPLMKQEILNFELSSMPPVIHFTKSKSNIKSDVDQELKLLNILHTKRKTMKDFVPTLPFKPILCDKYQIKKPKELYPLFCDEALRCMNIKNAGAESSKYNEAISINYFKEKFKATGFLLEMEVKYYFERWKIVDYICNIYGHRVGVSVTRAINFFDLEHFTTKQAKELINKKLFGLIMARKCVSQEHSFDMCFLHIWCYNEEAAKCIEEVYDEVIKGDDSDTYKEVIILTTVCDDFHIYNNCVDKLGRFIPLL